MQAELSQAGEFVGVVILAEDGVTIDLESPFQQEQVETAFREAGPITNVAGNGEPGKVRWKEFSRFGDRAWFERVLRDLASEGYDFHLTKTDTG